MQQRRLAGAGWADQRRHRARRQARSSTPCSTSSDRMPWLKVRRDAREPQYRPGSLIAKRFHRIEAGRPPSRVDRGEERQDQRPWRRPTARRSISTLAGSSERKRISADHSSVPSRLSRPRRMVSMLSAKASPRTKPVSVPTMPMLAPLRKKMRSDRAAGGAHGAQDRDVTALAAHQHGDAGDDVERRDQDDQGQDQEHDVALDLERREEMRVQLLPVDQTALAASRRSSRR